MDVSSIKNILLKYGAKPSKGLGQNFLINNKVLDNIIEASVIKPDDIVVEIGPGLGALTERLATVARKVIAVEKDPKMCQILKETLKDYKNVEIILDDVLKIRKLDDYLKIKNYKIKNYKLVANLPYYITSPVIRKFLENPPVGGPPESMILMVQKEVAQRICAKPPQMSLLAVSVQFYAKAKIVSYVSKQNFWPKPKVDSAIIKIIPLKADGDRVSVKLFFEVVRAGFAQPRKQLVNNLSKNLKVNREKIANWLLQNKIQPQQRAETLTLVNWINLIKTMPVD